MWTKQHATSTDLSQHSRGTGNKPWKYFCDCLQAATRVMGSGRQHMHAACSITIFAVQTCFKIESSVYGQCGMHF